MNKRPTAKQLYDMLHDMDDLCARLQEDYAGTYEFEQMEQDRIVAYNICEMLEAMIDGKF